MYVAAYDAVGKHWLQGCVRLPPHAASPRLHNQWQKTLLALLSLLGQNPDLRLGLRVEVDQSSIILNCFAVVEAAREAYLRKLLGSFTRLNTVVEDSVELPAARESHDGILESFPRSRALLTIPDYRLSNEAWAGCNIAAWPILAQLIEEAPRLGHTFAYQVNFEPCYPTVERCRAAKINAL